MAAKLLHSLADENPDLQKQIGCMTGIFQIFDRQQLISGRRPNPRRLLPPPPPTGNSECSNEDLDADSSNAYNRATLEKNLNKNANEKRGSTESSRASFSSSSRSSSFSSLDCGRTGQPEPSSMDRIIFPETPSRDPVISQTSASPRMGRLSVDIRDVVKDSMYRDSRGLPVQTTAKEEDKSGYTLKHGDSPRPQQLSKSVDGSLGVGMKGNNMTADIKESLRVLAKLRDARLNYNENEQPRLSHESQEESFFPIPRDAPRFSYDGREISRKIKDLPRFSLDSRESSARSSNTDSKLSSDISNERAKSALQPLNNQSRPSSVVARLMGLDLLPDSKRSNESQLGPIKMFLEDNGPSLAPLRVTDVSRPVCLPKSPRSTRKESTSPRWKNSDTIMKPIPTSKIPIEPAPWKNLDGGRASPKQASKQIKSSPSTSSTSPSVLGEMEKRLKDIEFKQSGKDLRALKQILEAMQVKGILEASKDEYSFNVGDKRDHGSRIGSDTNAGSSHDFRTNRAIASKQKGSGTSKAFESPIVIMKPAKLVQKSSIPASSIIPIDGLSSLQRPQSSDGASHRRNSVGSKIPKDQTIKDSRINQAANKKFNNRNLKVAPSSSRSSQIAKDSTANSSKNSGSVSPRLQQKKLEFDKRSRPPTPPADSNKSRRQPSRQTTESSSPGGRQRLTKTSSVQQIDDQSSEKCSESRNLCCQEDNVYVQSDANLEPRMDTESTSTKQPVDAAVFQSPSGDKCWVSEEIKEDLSLRLIDESMMGYPAFAPEQPSPVSVLNSSAYMEGSPSPVKQTIDVFKVAESNDAETELWSTVDEISTQNTVLELPSEISRKKLQSIDNLVQKLRRLNSTHDEAQTDYIASLCENTNPDHRYISEILLASGLLLRELSSGFTAFQLHPSGHPINPELFYVLEQTKASSLLAKGGNVDEVSLSKSKPEKFHRKLIFDAVNEILTGKLAIMGQPSEPWLKPAKLAKKTLNAQKLLRELCSEIELLQVKKQDLSLEEEEDGLKCILWEDVVHRSDSWTDFRGEFSNVVLDIERSIFKDLVNEIVIGESACHQRKPNRRCRQLFSK
ncbi:protein LONGIFOLIA 1-like isoform X1 [Chenopodium quinoa]|uniref:protein LONGIFOLIA 1-like isoform X1 n=2 Tax=Chenopodium quinoa TaxID=63459 RepID=UPI000B78365E|nr:protein LONGIFOLIA 1-like isoform X1 [Chenopodium quinoa]XP_021757161.1 protein LONGIFOLIA 1-like isoform X1 [Chenopodium quinoa]